jgi:hypothetical protein
LSNQAAPEERSGREIRLLMLVIIVAVAGLLVLARFRFPAAEIVTVSPTPSPLDRLAVRAPFEELGTAAAAAAARVMPFVTAIEIEPVPEPAPRKNGRSASKAPESLPAESRRWQPALRVAVDRLLVYVPAGTRPAGSGGQPAQIVGEDARHALALVSSTALGQDATAAPAVVDLAAPPSALTGYQYVMLVEASEAGPAARPIFLPRLDTTSVELWDSPIMRIGGESGAGPGAFLFTMAGRLIGLTVADPQGLAVVGAATLDRLSRDLARTPSGVQ